MNEIIKISLDLTDCKYIRDFHERIRVALDFPEWYGANLDALWDLLSEPCFMGVSVVGQILCRKNCVSIFLK